MADSKDHIDHHETASGGSNPRVDDEKVMQLAASITQDDVTP
jgi:hypothetical protein